MFVSGGRLSNVPAEDLKGSIFFVIKKVIEDNSRTIVQPLN